MHWLMAIIIISLIALGLIMGEIPHENPMRGNLYMMHKSFGVLVFLLFFIRISLRLRYGTPPLPEAIPSKERKLAHLGHYAFYFFMVAMPVSGYLMSSYFGFTVPFFGLALPKLTGIDRAAGGFFADMHGLLAYVLIGLIILHIAGVIKHWLSEKINLLKRMW